MDIEKLKSLEPFFDGWTIESTVDKNEKATLYRVMKVSSDGSVGFRHLNVETVIAPPPRSDGDFPEDIKLKLLELDIMQKMKNCERVVSYYDSRAVYNSDGEYAIISLRECVKPLSDEYDLNDLPTATALKAVLSACDAVAQFRSMGITHENISLENIFITSLGEFKLGSFAATSVGEECKAPEEYSPDADISQSDMYKLGMLLFKALNKNRAPFLPQYPTEVTQENLSNALQRRLGGEVPSAPENSPTGTEKIIKKACAFKPKDRYQNLSSIKRDIEAVLSEIDPTYKPKPTTTTGYAFGQSVPKTQREQEDDDDGEIVIKDDAPGGYGFENDYYDDAKDDSGKIIKGLIVAIVAVAVLSLAFIAYGFLGKSEPVTTEPITSTTAPTTTQPTTTQPTTTEPTTTQPTTTEPTAPTVPTETTTKPEVSTTVITTEATTTTSAPVPEYVSVDNPKFELIENEGTVEEVIVFANAVFGTKVRSDGEALLYTYDESGTIIKTQPVSVECYYDLDHAGMTICDIVIPSDVEINTDEYTYEMYFPKDLIQGTDSKNEAFSVEF